MTRLSRTLTFLLLTLTLCISGSILYSHPAQAARLTFSTPTICVGKTTTLKLIQKRSNETVKWTSSNSKLVKITSKTSNKATSSCTVKGLKATKGTYVHAKLYKNGKFVKTYTSKVIVKSHSYIVTRRATCQSTGFKTCIRCGDRKTTSKLSHSYMWVLTDTTTNVAKNTKDITNSSSSKSIGIYQFMDKQICRSNDTYSEIVSNFSKPASRVASGKVLYCTINTACKSYRNSSKHSACGKTRSGALLLNSTCSISDGVPYSSGTKFKNLNAYSSYSNEINFNNSCYKDIITEKYKCTMPKGSKEGSKKYVLLYSDMAFHWLTYKWTAVCH